MGSPNEFGWLAITNVTSPLESHRNSLRDPAAAPPCAFAPLFTPQKFDYENRFAIFSAQNDIQKYYLFLFQNAKPHLRP